ncbi:hypothetical protein ACFYVL_41015 [Streptomyces sp. NPDC004111]|uniref:hypothetical protein n=1 Tax=Streptomyces sp. NPDC004111 TaxID=3364690 RepID=UPI0036B4ADBD
MTSTTGTTQHPDVAEISDLAEGLLSPSRTEDVRQHLDGCELCADVELSLEEIRGLLGTLPGPSRMPADVAGRIDAALAAEALLNSTAPDTADEARSVSRETSQSEPRPVAPASVPDRPSGHARAATGPGRASSRRPRRRAVWGAVLGTAALGLGVLLVQSFQAGPTSTGKDAAASAQSQQFSGAPLQDQVQILAGNSRPGALTTPREKNAPSLDVQENTPSAKKAFNVPSCIQQGTGRTEAPLGSEQGTYEGKQAFLLVLPHPSDSSQVQAYVVDAACVDKAPKGKGELLLTHAYPRR